MKTTILSTCAMFTVLSAVSSFAATIIVDNNPNHAADHRTLQAAVDAAAAGDTILIGPSFNGISYGDATIHKQLKVYGVGYFLNENRYTGGPDSIVGNLTLEVRNISGNANGSIISGVSGLDMTVSNESALAENIKIARNYFNSIKLSIYQESGNNIIIESNFIACKANYCGIYVGGNVSAVIRNNISSTGLFVYGGEVLVTNNSFLDGQVLISSDISGDVYNNIGDPTSFTTDAETDANIHDNYLNTRPNLEDFVYLWTGSEDAQYQLRSNSLAKGACLNGADCGAFAGATPYILSGLPPRPRITTLEVPASVLKTDATMQVKVSAESRN